jgi:anti-sigma factor RsiW
MVGPERPADLEHGMSEHNLSQVIRAYVDGELDAEQHADLAKRLEDDATLRARVRFERQLQERIGAAMGTGAAPAALADRIRAALAEAKSDAEGDAEPEPEIVIGRVDADGASSHRSWLVGPQRANIFAVAAVLAIIAGVVLVGIFGPQIGNSGPDAAAVAAKELLKDTASFAARVHTACTDVDVAEKSSPWRTIEESQARLSNYLGENVLVVDLAKFGFQFVGGGKCRVPGVETSGHVVYRCEATADKPEVHVTVFMVPNEGQYGDQLPRCGMCDPLECPKGCCHRVIPMPADEVIYFLVCSDPSELARLKEFIARRVGAVPNVR